MLPINVNLDVKDAVLAEVGTFVFCVPNLNRMRMFQRPSRQRLNSLKVWARITKFRMSVPTQQ